MSDGQQDGKAILEYAIDLQTTILSSAPGGVGSEDRDRLIALYEQAIECGLSPSDEVTARQLVGNQLLERGWSSGSAILVMEKGLETFPDFVQGLQHVEQALKCDSKLEVHEFATPIQRHVLLSIAPLVWEFQANFIENSRGEMAAAVYREEKLALLDYLGGSHLPALCLGIGNAYGRSGDSKTAAKWFRKAIDADVPPPSSAPKYKVLFVDTKVMAERNLKIAESDDTEAKSPGGSGCAGSLLIATVIGLSGAVTLLIVLL